MSFVALCECGPNATFALRIGAYRESESRLAQELLSELKPRMLCLADRLYANFGLWQKALRSGAALLWRTRSNAKLPVEKVLQDGSYLLREEPCFLDQFCRRFEYEHDDEHERIWLRISTSSVESLRPAADPVRAFLTTLHSIERAG